MKQNGNANMAGRIVTAILVCLVATSLNAQTIEVRATAVSCDLNCYRATYQNMGLGGEVPGSGIITAGATAKLVQQTYSSAVTNRWFIVRLDGQIVFTKFITGPGDYTVYTIGAYYGDSCQSENTIQTYTALQQNKATQTQKAWWKLNGNIVKEIYLSPGTSDSYTFNFNPQSDSITWGMATTDITFESTDTGDGLTLSPLVNEQNTYSSGGAGSGFSNGGGNANTLNVSPQPVNNPPVTQQPWSNYATSGTINFTGTATTAARDDTLKAGFNALLDSQNAIRNQIGLAALYQGTNGSGSGSDISITVTNLGWTNGLTKEQLAENTRENQSALSNRLGGLAGTVSANTSGNANYMEFTSGLAAGTLLGNAGLPGAYTVPVDGGASGPSAFNVNLGSLAVMSVDPSIYPFTGGLRTVLKWCILLGLFAMIQKEFFQAITEMMNTPQASTAGEAVLGTNLNAGSALVMAAVIVGIIFAVVAVTVGGVIGTVAAMTGLTGPGTVFESFGWGANFVGTFLPIGFLVGAIISYCVFVILKGALRSIAMAAIKFAIGL